MDHSTINLLHVLVVAPLLIYVGYTGKKCDEMLFNLLLVLGVVVLLYHLSGYLSQGSSESAESAEVPEGFEDLDEDVGLPPEVSDALTGEPTEEELRRLAEEGDMPDDMSGDMPESNEDGFDTVEGFSW